MMPEVFETENEYGSGVVKSWASVLDDNAREQAEAVSRVKIVSGHLALMPDAHFGYGPPVGSVIKTVGAIMPYAIGVDIGCGMIAVKTDLNRVDLIGHEGKIMQGIRERIPAGVFSPQQSQPLVQSAIFLSTYGEPPGLGPSSRLMNKQGLLSSQHESLMERLTYQFGTLGSGNHFVEVCEEIVSGDRAVWLLLHSGSRGIGNILATAHVNVAKQFCKENGIELENKDLAYVFSGSRQFLDYITDMRWCQDYAYAQREAMMDNLVKAVEEVMGPLEQLERINCHHNYAESVGDEDGGVWLTRKGAIDASPGRLGIIPGSMGAVSYIVQGRGDAESYNSSPHGAGRVMGRGRQARKGKEATGAFAKLDIEEFKKQMEGRTWQDRDAESLLDEAPGAYKNIDQVMVDSASLVKAREVLTQFINYKGT